MKLYKKSEISVSLLLTLALIAIVTVVLIFIITGPARDALSGLIDKIPFL